jgi:hypothetical protein
MARPVITITPAEHHHDRKHLTSQQRGLPLLSNLEWA